MKMDIIALEKEISSIVNYNNGKNKSKYNHMSNDIFSELKKSFEEILSRGYFVVDSIKKNKSVSKDNKRIIKELLQKIVDFNKMYEKFNEKVKKEEKEKADEEKAEKDVKKRIKIIKTLPIIRSVFTDSIGQVIHEGDSARGDGFCSVWAVLVGWSILKKDRLIKNVIGKPVSQPTNIDELLTIIIDVADYLYKLKGKDNEIKLGEQTIYDFEINPNVDTSIQNQIKSIRSGSTDARIDGQIQFKIFSYLFEVTINIYDTTSKRLETYKPYENNNNIWIHTNNIHYHNHNIVPEQDLSILSSNLYWWNQQWIGYKPGGRKPVAVLPFFKDPIYLK